MNDFAFKRVLMRFSARRCIPVHFGGVRVEVGFSPYFTELSRIYRMVPEEGFEPPTKGL